MVIHSYPEADITLCFTFDYQQSMECPICQSDVLLPVHFTCFPCECGEDYCVCLQCARTYLQLNKDRHERVPQRKCVLCPRVVNPSSLSVESRCLRKNRIYMRLDPAVHPCFHTGCDFRGTQCELERHLEKECLQRTVRCPCGASFSVASAQDHQKGCCHYTQCRVCEAHVPLDGWKKHLRREHDLVACSHVGCLDTMAPHQLEKHLVSECRHRLVSCTFCREKKIFHGMATHMSRHLAESRYRVDVAAETLLVAQKDLASVMEAQRDPK